MNTGAGQEPKEIGKYVVERRVGAGATSTVYLARDPFTNREVAVKVATPAVLHDPAFGAQYRILFRNEASLAGRLHHPHIVELLDAVVDEDQQYIVMEYLPGATLETRCQPDTLLSFDKVVDVIFKCSQALDYANRQGVIHRDIKPANIMMTQDGDIKLADFGASLSLQATVTQIKGAVGSLAYMSPEQLRGEEVTHQADIYSLGVVMFQLLSGRLPHQAASEAALIQKILNEPLPSVRDVRPEVSRPLAAVVARATAGKRARRYGAWWEFAHDLSEAMGRIETVAEDLDDTRKFNILRRLRFFQEFTDVEIWETVRIVRWGRFQPGKVLLQEGEFGRSFFVLAHGSARVMKGSKLLTLLKPGDSFGEMAYIEDNPSPRTATVVAESEVVVLKVRSEALQKSSDNLQLRFNKALLRLLSKRLASTAELYVNSQNV
jgi:serine/threonine protein kinase